MCAVLRRAAGCAHLVSALCRLLVAVVSAEDGPGGWVPTVATVQAAWRVCRPLPDQLIAAPVGDGGGCWSLLDSASQQPAAELFTACLSVMAAVVTNDVASDAFADDAQHPVCRYAAAVPPLFASASAGHPDAAVLRRRHTCLSYVVYGVGRLVPGGQVLTGTELGEDGRGQLLLARQRLPHPLPVLPAACTARCLHHPLLPHMRHHMRGLTLTRPLLWLAVYLAACADARAMTDSRQMGRVIVDACITGPDAGKPARSQFNCSLFALAVPLPSPKRRWAAAWAPRRWQPPPLYLHSYDGLGGCARPTPASCPPVLQALHSYGDGQLVEPGGSPEMPLACCRAMFVLARLMPGLLKYAQAQLGRLPELVSMVVWC